MQKTTSKIIEELQYCTDFKKYYEENTDSIKDNSLAEYLENLLKTKNAKKIDVIKKSELNEIYAYQIFSGIRVPERNKILSIAIGFNLNISETQLLLKHNNYPQLYAKNKFDSIIIYGISNKLSVSEINQLLYDYDLDSIG